MDVFAALAGHAMGGRGELRPVPQLGPAVGVTFASWGSRAMPAGSRTRVRIPAHRARRSRRADARATDTTVHVERWP